MQSVLAKHQITQVTQHPYSPYLTPCDFQFFPKLKSPLKGKRFQNGDEIQENMMGQLRAIGRTMWGLKVPTTKGTEASLSYVQWFLYFASSSVNISIFHSTWLDTFWTGLIYRCKQTKRKVIEPVSYVYHWNNKYMKQEVRICFSKSCSIPLLWSVLSLLLFLWPTVGMCLQFTSLAINDLVKISCCSIYTAL